MIRSMINTRSVFSALLTVWCGALSLRLASASPLENLVQSKTMQHFKTSEGNVTKNAPPGQRRDTYLKGIDPTSNFAILWRQPNGGLELLNWAGAKLPNYRAHKARSVRKDEIVLGEIDLLDSKKATAKVTIVVPHPSMSPLVEANVLPEMRGYKPPVLKVVSEKTIALTEATGTLYETEQGACVIVVPLEQKSLVNIGMADCKNTDMLVDIAKSLDIPRLNRKLNS